MISLEDCIALCGLDPDEVAAIAEHEQVPEVVATEIGWRLLQDPGGAGAIRQFIVDDLRAAIKAGRRDRAAELLLTLRHYIHHHPEACMRSPLPSPVMCEELATHSRTRLRKNVDEKVRSNLKRELRDWQALAARPAPAGGDVAASDAAQPGGG
jgi:hypothetical protein